MKLTKLLYGMTWMAIWILIALPVAFADQLLTVQRFSGRDNVPGFARENDELTVQLLAQMIGNPTPEVARQRARILNEDTYTFMDSCVAQGNNIEQCVYKTQDLIYAGTDDYTVKLYDADNREIAAVNKTLTVDFLAPKMVAFSVSPNMSGTAVPTTVTYKAEDYGGETGKTTQCAGIKLINITANGAQIASITANLSTCVKQGSFTFTPAIAGASSRVAVCAVATDYLNHRSLPACKDILIDSRKPVATALELRDTDGFVLSHVRSNQPIIADVAVRIPDVDIDSNSVTADLSKLNPNLGRVPRSAQAGEWFIWKNVQVTTPATCKVTADARDLMGNTASTPLTCTIGIDDTAPVPSNITTLFVDEDGTPLLGVNGTINVGFTESGSGLDKRNAFLDLRALGLGTEVRATSCERTGTDAWTCSWNVRPAVASGDYKVKLLPTTRDDLNNQIAGMIERVIRFDNSAPSGVRLKEIAAFRGQSRVRTNVTSLGETLEFVVTGAGYTTARADLSDLGGSETAEAERCTGNLTLRDCVFSVTTAVSGPQPTNITFTFADVAGNKATLTTSELFILGISNETAPNYWNVTADCSPTLLDRKTLSVFEHPVYCRLRMKSPNKKAIPITVDADPSQCAGGMDYVSDLQVENNYAGSTEPYIVLTLVATDFAVNNLSVTCPMSTLTRVGNFLPQNTEQDNVTINLNFYNLPLGELYDNINDEVHAVKDNIGGVWKVIGDLEKFMSYAEKFCQILNVIIGLLATISSVLAILGVTSAAVRAIPIVGPAIAEGIDAASTAMCHPTETTRSIYNDNLLGIFKKFCDFLTCQSGLFDVLGATGIMDEGSANSITSGTQNGATWWLSMGDSGTQSLLNNAIAKNGSGITNPAAYLNVRDSLIYSIVIPPLCIPGIIHNLDKWRQIECRYGVCLLDDVRQQGLPPSICKDQKHYMECSFVLGEIFNIIPFAPIVDYYLNIFQNAISDPLVLVSMGLAFLLKCDSACDTKPPGIVYYACAAMSILSQLGQAVNTIRSLKSIADFGSISNTWCDQFKDQLDDYEAEAAGPGGTA